MLVSNWMQALVFAMSVSNKAEHLGKQMILTILINHILFTCLQYRRV